MTLTDLVALVLLFVVIATMPVFAFRSSARALDADVAGRPTTVILGFWVRDWLMWIIAPLERWLVRTGVSPDLFNYLGVLFGVAAAVGYGFGELALAGWMILLSGLADVLDGRIARARNLSSLYGAFLDSTLDRFAEAFMFLGIVWYFASDKPWTVTVTLLAVSGSLLVSYTRARGEALGVDCRGGIMQRAERVVLLAIASLFDAAITSHFGWRPGMVLAGTLTLIGVGSFGTAVYRTAYIAQALARRDAEHG